MFTIIANNVPQLYEIPALIMTKFYEREDEEKCIYLLKVFIFGKSMRYAQIFP